MDEETEEIRRRVEQMHSKQLEMFKWYHEFCVENGIKYFVVGGTLLGAVRHKGFIPWDDDVDIGMPRPDYDRFVQMTKGLKGRFVTETVADGNKDYPHKFCRIYDTTTTVVYNEKIATKRGLFIDVFPLDGLGNTEEESAKYYKKMKNKVYFLNIKSRPFRKSRKFYQNAAIIIGKLIPYNWRKGWAKLENKLKQKNYYESAYVANMYGVWRDKEIMKREWIGEPKLYDFESIKVFGPQDADSFLKRLYGDYMTPPPEDKRYPKHDFLVLHMDLNKSYLDE